MCQEAGIHPPGHRGVGQKTIQRGGNSLPLEKKKLEGMLRISWNHFFLWKMKQVRTFLVLDFETYPMSGGWEILNG